MNLTPRPFGHAFTALFIFLFVFLAGVFAQQATEPKISFDLPAGEARPMLKQFAAQAHKEILFDVQNVSGITTNAVKGDLTPREALDQMLAGTGLIAGRDAKSGAFAIRRETPVESKNVASRPASDRAADRRETASKGEQVLKLDTFEVFGRKTLNMDLRRTHDDAQPYVTFDREAITRSGTTDLNDFLRTRLTANTAGASSAQTGSSSGNVSQVNLRGMGENQTLILIDGRRTARTSAGFSAGQTDLNGIPLDAIERIEVLPSTASAIYGGSATGGVINIIMRRDYAGTDIKLTYDNTFDTDSASRRVDLSTGFSLNDGRTNVFLSSSFADTSELSVRDRPFLLRGKSRLFANRPAALLGSNPPTGGSANIRSTTGDNLVLDNGTPLNSFFTSAPVGYAGVASDNGVALVANAGHYNLGPGDSAYFFGGGNAGFNAGNRVISLSGSVRHEFGARVQGFVEASSSENYTKRLSARSISVTLPASSPLNPFQQNVIVNTQSRQLDGFAEARSRFVRYASGVILKLPQDWQASLDYTYTESELGYLQPRTPLASLGAAAIAGTLDVIRDLSVHPVDLTPYLGGPSSSGTPLTSTLKNPALRVGGPLHLHWFAESPRLSLKLERQNIKYQASLATTNTPTLTALSLFPERTQLIDSAYAELALPLVAPASRLRWARSLEVQVSGRWDSYETLNADSVVAILPASLGNPVYVRNRVGDFNPMVGVRFQPIDSLTVRASYGTGFFPPEVTQLGVSSTTPASTPYVDLRRGGTGPVGTFLLTSGGNPTLQPESSESWSAGVIVTPAGLPRLRFSLDYTIIEKLDEITTLTVQQVLDNESTLPTRVTRGPNLATDPAGWAGPVTALNTTTANIASTRVKAYDFQVDYTLPRRSWGQVTLFAGGTYQPELLRRIAPSLPELNAAGIVGGASTPVKFKANASATLNQGRWTFGWNGRYYDGYYVANPTLASSALTFQNQGNGGRVPSQTYHDIFVQYRIERHSDGGRFGRLFSGIELQAGVRNIFNHEPPYDVTNDSTYYSRLGDPRLTSYYLSARRSF